MIFVLGWCRNIIYYAMSSVFEEFASYLSFCDDFFHYGEYMGVYVSHFITGECINITFIKNGIFYDSDFSADVLPGFVRIDRMDDILANFDFENIPVVEMDALLPIGEPQYPFEAPVVDEDVLDLNIFADIDLPSLLSNDDVLGVCQDYTPSVQIITPEPSLPSANRRSERIAFLKARRNNPIA